MPYKRLEHTADIRILVEAKTLEDLFRDSFTALMELMDPLGIGSKSTKREISVESIDETTLLIDFLSEALAEAEIENETFRFVEFKEFSGTRLVAEVEAFPIETFAEDIKAVTYSEVDVKKNDKGEWESTVVFDV